MSRIAILYKTLGLLIFLSTLRVAYHIDLHHQHSQFLDAHQISDHLEKQLNTLKTDMAKKEIYANELSKTQKLYNNSVVLAFPAHINVEKFNAAGVQLTNVKLLTPIQKYFYTEVPAQITVLGTYAQILQFMQLTSAGNGPLLLWNNWTLTHQSKAHTTVLNEKAQDNLLEMNVEAVFFTLP